jgi:hypothetical protein
MKKLLSLAIVAAVLGVGVGCDDKKTTGGTPKPPGTGTGTAPAGAGTGTGSR